MSGFRSQISFPINEVGVNLDSQDQFIKTHGVSFTHWIAIPSPIGLKDRGDYRRSGQYDTISSNGMIYKKAGCFVAAIVSNSKKKTQSSGGVFDYSVARLLVPRFYEETGEEIALAPGDRVFITDKEVLVPNYQRMQYIPGSKDRAQFPIKSIQYLIDNENKEYKCGVHFKLSDGHIQWIDGKGNPGVNMETGKGNIYSIRYKYNAHWYITEIPNEVRVINNTNAEGEVEVQRMQYSALIQREYVYYNQNNDIDKDHGREKEVRDIEEPIEQVNVVGEYQVKIDMNDIE